jgi:V8-like Glu-specific endopeptidase
VTKNHLLTAAHCLKNAHVNQILLGVTNLWQYKEGSILEVVKNNPHPEYKKGSYYYDVAVLTVNQTIKYGPKIRPVCLLRNAVDNSDQHSSKLTTLTGKMLFI